jgi:hypothetical protein
MEVAILYTSFQFLLFVFEIRAQAGINDLQLVSIDKIHNSGLFTGLPYQLVDPEDHSMQLAWQNAGNRFAFEKSANPVGNLAQFYFLNIGGYIYLRNGALAEETVVVKCNNMNPLSCYLTGASITLSAAPNTVYSFYNPNQLLTSTDTLSPRKSNTHRLDSP